MKKWILGIGLCACVVLIGAKDYTQAFKLYAKACKSGIESSCADVGKMYDLSLAGVVIDHTKARSYYTKACDLGYQEGCKDIKL